MSPVVGLSMALGALVVASALVRRALHSHGLGAGRRSVEVGALVVGVAGHGALPFVSALVSPAVGGALIGVATAALGVPGYRLLTASRLRRVFTRGPRVETLPGPVPEWSRDLLDSAAALGFTTPMRFLGADGADFVAVVRAGSDHWLDVIRGVRRPWRSMRRRPTLVVISATANGTGTIYTSGVPLPLVNQRNVLGQWAPDLGPHELIDRHTALLGRLVDRGLRFARPADPEAAEAAEVPPLRAMAADPEFEHRLWIGVSDALECPTREPDDAEIDDFVAVAARSLLPPPPPLAPHASPTPTPSTASG